MTFIDTKWNRSCFLVQHLSRYTPVHFTSTWKGLSLSNQSDVMPEWGDNNGDVRERPVKKQFIKISLTAQNHNAVGKDRRQTLFEIKSKSRVPDFSIKISQWTPNSKFLDRERCGYRRQRANRRPEVCVISVCVVREREISRKGSYAWRRRTSCSREIKLYQANKNDADERSINFTKFRLALYGRRKRQRKTAAGPCRQMGTNSTIPEPVRQTNMQRYYIRWKEGNVN